MTMRIKTCLVAVGWLALILETQAGETAFPSNPSCGNDSLIDASTMFGQTPIPCGLVMADSDEG